MSEQAPEVETPETPETPDVAVNDQPEPEVDWKQRYESLRPEFDRRSQEAAQLRAIYEGLNDEDPDTRRAAAEALGLEFAEPEDDDEELYEDPNDRRLSALEQTLADREAREAQQQQEQAEREYVDQVAGIVEQQLSAITDDQETSEWILTRSLSLPKTPEGLPDIEAAHADFVALENKFKTAWASSKQGHRVSPVGTSGTQAPDLDDDEQRIAWMAAQLDNAD